jgi:putative PIN family toxin of toxin-antitoxin system
VRVVLDTNVVASALLWGGTPERLIEAVGEGRIELVTSEALLAELAGILGRSKFARKLEQKNLSAAELVSRYRELAETVEPAPIEETALRDPDDAAVLACALAGHAEAIVSGDGDLLSFRTYQNVPILTAAECARRVGTF